ncbi:unnamed protein product [Rotaria sp. Silwood1]|nr:unnamed protein product [Rotaria sp. Silwood1]CAF1662762.1 unnamed protein product [Rotaria sp. Silwood1]CAF3865561.1 unnamed protein product [Rotaria sp. Silwood1]CAF4966014.1 unnamed protein product [Rotaria sp. Silwood1]
MHQPPGNTLHQVYAGSNLDDVTLVKEFSGYTSTEQWLTSTFNPPLENTRFIQIKSIKSPSWIAWQKIFIYGRKVSDDQIPCTVMKFTDKNRQYYTVNFREDGVRG